MEGDAAEVAKKIGVLLEHRHIDTGSGEQPGNAAPRFSWPGPADQPLASAKASR